MSMWTAIVLIVAVVMLSELGRTFLKSKDGKRQKELDEQMQDKNDRIDALEKRIRVLETIVTDSSRNLKDTIDKL